MRSYVLLLAVALVLLAPIGSAHADSSDTATYSATQTIPVPPASNFAGSGGGDGWAIELSSTEVFNVFHHNSHLTVACHLQSDASSCWSPRTITQDGGHFATNGHPEMHLDQATGKLYVLATRSSTGTAGVVCIDTTQAAANPNPFCGFIALTPAGEGPVTPSGTSGVSTGMLLGNRWYAFNYVNGVNVDGARNKLLCFDVETKAPCAGQPYDVAFGPGNASVGGFPEPATAAIGSRLIIPINAGGEHRLACFDVSSQASCGGSFPVTLSFSYAAVNGAPFPTLTSSGEITGFCLPANTLPCFNLSGGSVATPAGMSGVIEANEPWNGPALVLGPRIYVPTGRNDTVRCFSFASGGSCPNYPKSFSGLGYLYSVNSDPQRPTCIWVNADNGPAQIQSFDAFTGGACGQGTTRVLGSQFIVPVKKCEPATYTSLQILEPGRSSYTDGSVRFADGDGNPIPGAADRAIDATGTVDLSGLQLNTATGLPQFLITLNGGSSTPERVVVKLTWTGVRDAECAREGTTVSAAPATATQVMVITTSAPSLRLPERRCLSRRSFRIRIVSRRRDPVRRARVTVAGRSVKTTRKRIGGVRRFTAVVDLRGITRSTVTIRITVRLRSGKLRKGKRVYRTCDRKLVGGIPKL